MSCHLAYFSYRKVDVHDFLPKEKPLDYSRGRSELLRTFHVFLLEESRKLIM